MYSKTKQMLSRFTYRKVPFLILYEVTLVVGMLLSPNPNNRMTIESDAGFYGLGLLFLFLLALVEKRKGLPLPFAESISKTGYAVAAVIAFFGSLLVVELLAKLLMGSVPYFHLGPFDPTKWFTYIWYFQFGIVEESMKIGLTNIFGIPALRTRERKWKNLVISAAGIVSAVLWAYSHILSRAFYGTYAFEKFLIACAFGIVVFAVTFWKRNYLPAVAAHGIYDIGVTLGYWI